LIHVKTPGEARGIVMNAQLKNMTDDQFDKVIDINLKGVYNCTRPGFIATDEASYINGAVIRVDRGITP
jgi:hypothetical protein